MNIELLSINYLGDEKRLELEFSVENDTNTELEYAYYIFRGNIKIDMVWYAPVTSTKMKVFYKPKESGNYSIRVFVRDKNSNKKSKTSKELFIDLNNNAGIELTFKGEKIFYLDDPVKYLFQPSTVKSPYLLVVFAGIHTREYKGGAPVYNYIHTLKDVDHNKLFILDEYKGQLCYYLGHNCKHDYEKAVIALITSIANQHNISANNIIACGSSKGGTASLYYGIKYHFGHVVCGAPQTFIADFLSNKGKMLQQALDNMTGSDSELGKYYINRLLLRLIEDTDSFPDIRLHIGKGDYHFEEHLVPLLEKLKSKDVSYSLDIQDYDNHSHTGTYYSPFLLEQLTMITKQ
jgi:hypothetical protein